MDIPQSSNEPLVLKWMSDDRVDFIKSVDGYFKDYCRDQNIELVSYKYLEGGDSSTIIEFETPDKPRQIAKFIQPHLGNLEVEFYSFCKDADIKTPNITFVKNTDKYLMCVMDFINDPNANKINDKELIEKGFYFEMGKTLARINQIKFEGDSKGIPVEDFESYKWARIIKSFPEIQKVFGERDISKVVSDQSDILIEDSAVKGLFLCHGDYSTSNLFYGQDLIVYDPMPNFGNPMLDLGLVIVYISTSDNYEMIREQILEGYKSVLPIDEKLLSAGIIIKATRKIITAARKSNEKRLNAYKKLWESEVERLVQYI